MRRTNVAALVLTDAPRPILDDTQPTSTAKALSMLLHGGSTTAPAVKNTKTTESERALTAYFTELRSNLWLTDKVSIAMSDAATG